MQKTAGASAGLDQDSDRRRPNAPLSAPPLPTRPLPLASPAALGGAPLELDRQGRGTRHSREASSIAARTAAGTSAIGDRRCSRPCRTCTSAVPSVAVRLPTVTRAGMADELGVCEARAGAGGAVVEEHRQPGVLERPLDVAGERELGVVRAADHDHVHVERGQGAGHTMPASS